MVYYELTDNSPFERQWPMAVSIRPTSRLIHWQCPECGRTDNRPSGTFDVVLEGGSKFPDLLGCGAYPLLIVSERVVATWKSEGIGWFLEHPVGIADVQDSQVKRELAPKYYRIEIVGEGRVDVVASGGRVKRICNRCGGFETEPTLIQRFKVFEGSWDGADLFRDHVFFPRVSFCTDKVAKLIRAKGFTNVRLSETL